MSLDTLNNGDSGLDSRTKINAAITAVNAGGSIVSGTGVLSGNIIPSVPAQGAIGWIDMSQWNNATEGTMDISNAMGITSISLSYSEPGTDWHWVDLNSNTNYTSVFAAIQTILETYGYTIHVTGISGGVMHLYDTDTTGVWSVLTITQSISGVTSSGQTTGTVEAPTSGATTQAVLIEGASLKKTIPLRVGWHSTADIPGVTACIALRQIEGDFIPIGEDVDLSSHSTGEWSNTNADFARIGDAYTRWVNGILEADLVVYYNDTPPDQGSVTFWAQAYQN